MFDDLKQDNPIKSNPIDTTPQTAAGTINSTSRQPQRATGIDDMFDDVDPVPNVNRGPVDPNKPSAIKSGKIKAISATSLPTAAQPAAQPAAYPTMPQPARPTSMPNVSLDDSMVVTDGRAGLMRKIIIAFLVIVLLAAVGGGVYYFFLKTKSLDNNQNNENTNMAANQNNTQLEVFNESDDEPLINEDELDDDFDGLTNGLEKTYGTNPLEVDSDNDGVFDQDEVETYKTDPLADDSDSDGLSDHQEIIIYKSDPNDPDTDGDAFLDGVEVSNGYNPLGAGKLEEATSTSDLNTNENL